MSHREKTPRALTFYKQAKTNDIITRTIIINMHKFLTSISHQKQFTMRLLNDGSSSR